MLFIPTLLVVNIGFLISMIPCFTFLCNTDIEDIQPHRLGKLGKVSLS